MFSIQPICCVGAWELLPYWHSDRSQLMRLQPRGHWLGTGCKLLGLHNPVRWDPLLGLLHGNIPSGENVVPRDQHTLKRIAAWRLTFTTPNRDLIRWGPDLAGPGQIGVAHVKAVTAALNRFDEAITATVDAPPWEESPKSVFAMFRGLPGRQHSVQMGTTVFFINLGFVQNQAAQIYTTEAVLKESELLAPTYLKHLELFLPRRAPVNQPLHSTAPNPAEQRQEPGPTPAQSRLVQDHSNTVQTGQLNLVHRYGHSH